MDFDSVLEEVLLVRGQGNLKLKQKQNEALQAIVVNGLIVLPTGYGKSLIYQMLPLLFDKTNLSLNVTSEGKSIVIVVSPLNALIDDQINKLSSVGVACTSLRVCGADIEERIFAIDDLQTGKFELIFTHPEVAVSNRQSKIVAMTATATKEYQTTIIQSLNMKDPKCVIANPDRANIFYEVLLRPSYLKQSNVHQFEEMLSPLADELKTLNVKMPVTIIYSSLYLCGVGYAFLDRKLGDHQFYPIGAPQIPQYRLFAQFHSPQTDKMKSEIITSIVKESCTQRVIFATVAFGMGVDSPCVERVVHFGVPRTMESFFPRKWKSWRDVRLAKSTLHFNNNDYGCNIEGMQPIMRDYCKNIKKT
ncbi:uncharacterized protein [Acropora muricata]|uniref:uncharacterized protein n=1 Tax=Acropora muricata TaxID=159855 RepID=UPI0034E52A0E